MKKAVYSVGRVGRFEVPKMSGLGYIVEDNLASYLLWCATTKNEFK